MNSTLTTITRYLRKFMIPISIIVILLVSFFVYRLATFRITGTNPDTGSFPAAAPYFEVNFNKQLTSKGMKVTVSDNIVLNQEVTGKKLKINFNRVLAIGKEYSVTISSISSKNGDVIKDRKYVFTAQDIPVKDLSENVQQTIISRQDRYPYEPNYINYENFDTLLTYGITDSQLNNIQTSLYDYSNIVEKKFWTMQLVNNTVSVITHDPDSDSFIDTANFKVVLDKQTYTVQAQYDSLYDAVHVQLFDQANAVVFDSAQGSD